VIRGCGHRNPRGVEMETEPTTILVIDDELGIREGCRRVLVREGHQVKVAATGEEGWQQVQSGHFDLVLLDVMMPDIGGMELLKRIVAFDPDLVCIIITGYATIELAVQAIKEGAYDFIAKPFDANGWRRWRRKKRHWSDARRNWRSWIGSSPPSRSPSRTSCGHR
jgi:DNA-binding NtrC family response regulator